MLGGDHYVIMDLAVAANFSDDRSTFCGLQNLPFVQLPFFQGVVERMKQQGCDAVVLGCTEIPLILNDENSPLPTLDSTRLLARAALDRALHAEAS
jgi:Asp/Glu/Hydantoin racemase